MKIRDIVYVSHLHGYDGMIPDDEREFYAMMLEDEGDGLSLLDIAAFLPSGTIMLALDAPTDTRCRDQYDLVPEDEIPDEILRAAAQYSLNPPKEN